jgi:hypothetical protein
VAEHRARRHEEGPDEHGLDADQRGAVAHEDGGHDQHGAEGGDLHVVQPGQGAPHDEHAEAREGEHEHAGDDQRAAHGSRSRSPA